MLTYAFTVTVKDSCADNTISRIGNPTTAYKYFVEGNTVHKYHPSVRSSVAGCLPTPTLYFNVGGNGMVAFDPTVHTFVSNWDVTTAELTVTSATFSQF
jgi:hypothetical protein